MKNVIAEEILHFEKGIENIQNEALNEYMRKAKAELIKQVHPYKITAPKKEGGRWQTYIKGSNAKNGRKQIREQTEEALLNKLAEIYFVGDTFGELYSDWIDYLLSYEKTGGTVLRHEQRYNKYLLDSKIPKMSVKRINILELEAECNRIVSHFNLTHHEWTNLKTILIGTFKYAVKKGIIHDNPMDKVEIGVRYRQVNKPLSETQVYKSDEYNDLMQYLDAKYAETEDDSFIGIKFAIYTGMRVGELAAVRYENIEGRYIHVVSEETAKKVKKGDKWVEETVVAPHTKTYEDRFITLPPQALEIIQKTKEKHRRTTGYIFTRDGERLRTRQYAYVLEKYAERKGKRTKSTHKLRKTYASRLDMAQVSIEQIRIQLGHKHLSTTMDYIYNPLTDDETYERMSAAF